VRAFSVSGHLLKGFVGTHLQIICTHVMETLSAPPTFHGDPGGRGTPLGTSHSAR
jgi:hypothetical protein